MTWDYYNIEKEEEVLPKEVKETQDKVIEQLNRAFKNIVNDSDAIFSILRPSDMKRFKDKTELVNHLTETTIEQLKKLGD